LINYLYKKPKRLFLDDGTYLSKSNSYIVDSKKKKYFNFVEKEKVNENINNENINNENINNEKKKESENINNENINNENL
jgi:hypothetical protein